MKELIRKILSEETKPGKYIGMIEDLTEYFKNEDCVCDIKVKHKPEEFRDSYLITVVLGNKDLDDKFNGISWRISDYRTKLKRKITNEVSEFLPIPFFVEFRQTPKCHKDLNESEDKNNIKKKLKVINLLLSQVSWDGLCDIWVEYDSKNNEYEIGIKSDRNPFGNYDIHKELEYLQDSLTSFGIKSYFSPKQVENCEDDDDDFLNESENKKEKSLESLEKSVTSLVNMYLEDYDLPSNFKKVAVDVTYDNYGRIECQLTMLVDGYFNWQISDKLQNIMKKIKKEIEEFFGNAFNGIQVEVSTVEIYEKIRWWYDQNKTKKLNESENKKSGLLRAIEEDGLYQVIQDTGLTFEQIILKYDNLPREVFERCIKDFIMDQGFHMTNGITQMGYDVTLPTDKYIDVFYVIGDKVTVDLHDGPSSGAIENLSNLSDDEIYTIVDDMKDYWD